ncbi:hypothetical protein AMES_6131 [Amycolatopsis mediterranei S699]|uniref:Uncharacterized protein n=2 Tax=Amycolatopsis mediterranei TaxID=33910 RepID=A0A0H3DBD3_AMYMU|nr:hypothetical protein [Amycolatopsis mediterranei]ADJ47956.1 hypothetical protein AMED_6221 [Amycolatopsis mediterranei U32]AEK44856.1 hypothetical protein RAM_31915 [Amycolatopsis mediterranei S699]AFO79667.1 hypothetical protein AMES_6131 [Amycolatopsis mediterranei S699]AGT86795.1 hypothetical protein B737_6131 [Amycolatopsis mediterranei RB]KDO10777.1 hypothetical protein DV26_11165 [Amycolatopsis mediterranei]
MDSSLFSHPAAEEPHPEALTAPQESRYGSLFLQPVYTPEPAPGANRRPEAANARAHDPSGRRSRR